MVNKFNHDQKEAHHHMMSAIKNSSAFKKKYGKDWKAIANGIAHRHAINLDKNK